MNKIVILTDSTCDLSNELIEQRRIMIMPLKVCFDGVEYLDGVDLKTPKMYKIVEEKNVLPKTAAITIEEFIKKFTELVSEGYDVIYTGIGSKLSSSYQNCMVAISTLNEEIASHIYPVDSGNLSTGIGLLVLKMCDMRDANMTAKEIQEAANKIVPCIRAQFSVKELTFLHKGGRCSGTARFFGTLLRIHPILRVFDGKIILSEKIFGRYEKSLDFQIADIVNNVDHSEHDYLFITHSIADDEAKYIYDNIPEEVKKKFKNIYITNAGCVISSHCGKGTIGILYIKDAPLVDDK
ncbi:MAG: DegV family protein [Erysipelotrichaceae bacterium]|nr:DegV family protein [Erysipelotrichaceae bacterium]